MIILRRMVIESNFIWRLSIKWTTRQIASVLQKFGTSRFSSTNLPHQAPLDALRPCSNGLHCGSSSVTVPVILKDGMPLNVFCSTLEMSRIANVQVAKETSTRQFEKHIEWHAMKSQFGVVVEFLIHLSWPPDQVTGGQKNICCNYHNSTRAFKVPLLPPGVQEMKFGKSMEEPTCRILKGSKLHKQYAIWELITNAACSSSYTSLVFVVTIAFQMSQSTLMSSIICHCFLHFSRCLH